MLLTIKPAAMRIEGGEGECVIFCSLIAGLLATISGQRWRRQR